MADCYTELEKAVVVLVENFYKYVSKHSLVKNKISKSSFRKMLQKELNHMLTVKSLPWDLASPLSALSGHPSPLSPLPWSYSCSPASLCLLRVPRPSQGGLCLLFPRATAAQALWGCHPPNLQSPPPALSPVPLQDTGNRKAADKLIQNLDANHDGRISFDEYWTLIGGITSPIANLIRQQEQQSSS